MNDVSRASSVACVKRRPMFATKVMPVSLMGPKVSDASGMKWWVLRRSSYFLVFLTSAISVAAPAVAAVACRYDGAIESMTVASQTVKRYTLELYNDYSYLP